MSMAVEFCGRKSPYPSPHRATTAARRLMEASGAKAKSTIPQAPKTMPRTALFPLRTSLPSFPDASEVTLCRAGQATSKRLVSCMSKPSPSMKAKGMARTVPDWAMKQTIVTRRENKKGLFKRTCSGKRTSLPTRCCRTRSLAPHKRRSSVPGRICQGSPQEKTPREARKPAKSRIERPRMTANSRRCSRASRVCCSPGTCFHAASRAKSPRGKLIAKSQGQDTCVSMKPPRAGPMIMDMDMVAVLKPMPVASLSFLKTRSTRAILTLSMADPPTACRILKRQRLPGVRESAQPRDAATKRAMPQRKKRLQPTRGDRAIAGKSRVRSTIW